MSKIEIDLVSDSSQAVKDAAKLEARVDALSKSHQQMTKKSMQGAKLVSGSMEKLERDYKDARKELKQLEVGSEAFDRQKKKVHALRRELDGVNSSVGKASSTASKGFGVVDRFTGELVALAGGLGAVTAIVTSVKSDLQKVARERENARLAQVDFGQVLASKTISNLAEAERDIVGPLANQINQTLGVGSGGIAETLGSLRSSGAKDIIEAGEFLLEAGKAFPKDLAQAGEIAKAGLIEARATGNRNPQQVIGGIVAAQATSQTTSVQDFAKAFSANTASAVANLKLTPEQAREEAAIFSILEPKSAEVAATAQNAFFTQLEKFVPSEGTAQREVFLAAPVSQRIQLLEQGGELLDEFISGLQDTGRNSIRRRLNQSQEDAATFKSVRDAIGNDQESAKQFRKLQESAQQNAAFALAEGRRNALQESILLQNRRQEAFQAEAILSEQQIFSNARTGVGGTASAVVEGFGGYVERLFTDPANLLTSKGDADTAVGSLEFLAKSAGETEETRKAAQAQLEILKTLRSQMELQTAANERGMQALAEALKVRQQEVQKVEVQNAGPVEAPVPAASAP